MIKLLRRSCAVYSYDSFDVQLHIERVVVVQGSTQQVQQRGHALYREAQTAQQKHELQKQPRQP